MPQVKAAIELGKLNEVKKAFRKVEEWKRVKGIQWKTDRLLSSMNTYVGMMKHKTMRRTTERFRDCVLDSFGRFLGWNPQKECFCMKERYTLKRVLERKYKVRL